MSVASSALISKETGGRAFWAWVGATDSLGIGPESVMVALTPMSIGSVMASSGSAEAPVATVEWSLLDGCVQVFGSVDLDISVAG